MRQTCKRNDDASRLSQRIRLFREDRLTLPTPSGKRYPILFGPHATPVLMYVALNPGCRVAEIVAALELRKRPDEVLRRLQRIGLVVRHRLRYQINPELAHGRELVPLLRRLGAAYGMPTSNASCVLRGGRPDYAPTALPEQLFLTRMRTSVLVFVAAIGETYAAEIAESLGIGHNGLHLALRSLVIEGVFSSRTVKRAKFYSLADAHPVASELRTLLRRVGFGDAVVRRAVRLALVRRIVVARMSERERRVSAALAAALPSHVRKLSVARDGAVRTWKLVNCIEIRRSRPYRGCEVTVRRPRRKKRRIRRRSSLCDRPYVTFDTSSTVTKACEARIRIERISRACARVGAGVHE